ncbi:transporter major facilitator family protein [Ruminococcus sp. CAG:488]|nr:transporter major facilitator family protein [Ruminococcus sp. CAG:488]
MAEKAKKMKLNYGKTLLIGFAFMASSIAWGVYDPYITTLLNKILGESAMIAGWSAKLVEKFPILLEFMQAQGEDVGSAATGFTLVPLFIGIIMTFDNIFGVVFQPTFGKISDRCHTRIGKRKPFILIGAPLAAVIFAIIPRVALHENGRISAMMFCIILFVFVMSFWRAPCVALMPDLTPPALRSEGNSVINLVGGVGSLLALQAATIVCAIGGWDKGTQEEEYIPYVFLFASIVMIICTLVVTFFVKEPDSRLKVQMQANMENDAKAKRQAEKEAAKKEKERLKAIKLSKGERVSLICMLAGLFFLFCGANAIQTFFALFAAEILGKSSGEATSMLTIFAVSTAIGAIPAGLLGRKFGRKKTIVAGLLMFITAFVVYLAVDATTGNALTLVYVALVVGGFANMLITVNTLPLVLEIGGLDKVGTFTGYYYTATFSAQIATPIVYGIVRMLTGTYGSLFYYCPICFILSLICILFVKHGESEEITEDIIEEARLADD